MDEIQSLLLQTEGVLRHRYRETNVVADALAKLASNTKLSLVFNSLFHFLWDFASFHDVTIE